jgi:hypothetical protein
MMTVKLLKDGKVCKVARSYGVRLIEQGLATIAEMPKAKKAEKPAKAE